MKTVEIYNLKLMTGQGTFFLMINIANFLRYLFRFFFFLKDKKERKKKRRRNLDYSIPEN